MTERVMDRNEPGSRWRHSEFPSWDPQARLIILRAIEQKSKRVPAPVILLQPILLKMTTDTMDYEAQRLQNIKSVISVL
jgi:hypothetical protein